MRNKTLLLFVTIISPCISYCKEPFNFNDTMYHLVEIRTKEEDIKSNEKGFANSNPYFNKPFLDIILKSNVTQKPLIFLRKNDDFKPQLGVWYFYDKDSLVHGISYRWSYYNPDFNPNQNLKIINNEKKRYREYYNKFYDIQTKLISILGEPKSEKISLKNYKQSVWENESHRTILYFKFDPSITKIPNTDLIHGGKSEIIIQRWMKSHEN